MIKRLLFTAFIILALNQITTAFDKSDSNYKNIQIEKTIIDNDSQNKVENESTKEIIKEKIIIEKEDKGFWYAPFSTWLQVAGSIAAVIAVIITLCKLRGDKKHNNKVLTKMGMQVDALVKNNEINHSKYISTIENNKAVIEKMSNQVDALIKNNEILEKQFLSPIKPYLIRRYYEVDSPTNIGKPITHTNHTYNFENAGAKAFKVHFQLMTERSYIDTHNLNAESFPQGVVEFGELFNFTVRQNIVGNKMIDEDIFELNYNINYQDSSDNPYQQVLTLNSKGDYSITTPVLMKR